MTTHPNKDALAKVREHLEAIFKGSCYDVEWESDGKDFYHANKALQHLAQIEQSLDATQRPEVETVTVDEFAERMRNEVVFDDQYSKCYGRAIARVFQKNGLRIVKGGE